MNGTPEHIDYYKDRCQHLEFKVEELSMQLAMMRRMIFGSKHERFIPSVTDPGQLSMDMGADKVESCEITSVTQVSYTKVNTEKKSSHPGRMPLPDHLPRVVTRIDPEPMEGYVLSKSCEVTEQLEFDPMRLWVKRTERYKLMKADAQTPGPLSVIAPLPPAPIHKCIAGPGLLSHLVVDKLVDHIPLDRQRKRFARGGMDIPYSTLSSWYAGTINLFTDLYDLHVAEVLSTGYLQADETGVKVIDKQKEAKKGKKDAKLHKGWYWLYQDVTGKKVIFDYQKGRGREGPSEMLKDFKGYLQTDGLEVYELFAADKVHIILLCCWAHARRYFEKARDLAKKATPELEHPLLEIQKLYAIERHCKEMGFDYAQIAAYRQQHATPILDALHQWMKQQRIKWGNINKLPFVEALDYSLKRWDKLCVYLKDGRLGIDNNPIENSVRPAVIGRRNFLFAGSHQAAQRNAMMYSLYGTCKMHGINPLTWTKDVLQRLHTHPKEDLWQLLPQHWKPIELEETDQNDQKQEEATTA